MFLKESANHFYVYLPLFTRTSGWIPSGLRAFPSFVSFRASDTSSTVNGLENWLCFWLLVFRLLSSFLVRVEWGLSFGALYVDTSWEAILPVCISISDFESFEPSPSFLRIDHGFLLEFSKTGFLTVFVHHFCRACIFVRLFGGPAYAFIS